LCNNLVQFAYKLSSAKRHTLEDPELYRVKKIIFNFEINFYLILDTFQNRGEIEKKND